MSNMGLDLCLDKKDIAVVKTQVGDRYVIEEMKKSGHVLGGEQSGHIIFLEHNTTGDGLLTALQLIEAVREQGKPLSELSSIMTTMPQVLINAKVENSNKHSYMEDSVIEDSIKKLEDEFHEPLVRVMIEGENEEDIRNKASELALLIENRLG